MEILAKLGFGLLSLATTAGLTLNGSAKISSDSTKQPNTTQATASAQLAPSVSAHAALGALATGSASPQATASVATTKPTATNSNPQSIGNTPSNQAPATQASSSSPSNSGNGGQTSTTPPSQPTATASTDIPVVQAGTDVQSQASAGISLPAVSVELSDPNGLSIHLGL